MPFFFSLIVIIQNEKEGIRREIRTNSCSLLSMKLPDNEASVSAMAASSDEALRVPCYCEENVWRLTFRKLKLQQQGFEPGTRYYVVFVSSHQKLVPMFYQKASETVNNSSDEPVFWDYHVILLERREDGKAYVTDVDTFLTPSPAPLDHYLDKSFRPDEYTEEVNPRFRVVDASVFLKFFSSDREHMRKNGKWMAEPPSYRCIQADEARPTSNLDCYRIMTAADLTIGQRHDDKFGGVMTMEQLREFSSTAMSWECPISLCY